MTSLFAFKLIAAAVIFSAGLIGGLIPIRIAKTRENLLRFGDSFASGVFLSAALFHMLPDAEEGFHAALKVVNYPYAHLLCGLAFVLLLLMERFAMRFTHKQSAQTPLGTAYLLMLVLSVHSIIAGAALGINTTIAGAIMIFIAIIAHKGSASFALSAKLHRYKLSSRQITKVIILFSLMTPLGIVLASTTHGALQTNTGQLLAAIFNAFAAGTFLYLGTFHTIVEPKALDQFWGAMSFVLGIVTMALVAIWI